MSESDPASVAVEMQDAVSVLLRRLRQTRPLGDLAPPETQALAALLRSAPVSSAELARLEGVSPQSIGATVSGLERRGLVSRRADPDDGRRQLLELTDLGRRRALDKRDARTDQFAAALESFTTDERRTLLATAPLLRRLADTLQAGRGGRAADEAAS